MDINTFKVVLNVLKPEKGEADKLQDENQDKKGDTKGCLKLTDYMVF